MLDNDQVDIRNAIKELMNINKIPCISLKNLTIFRKIGEGGQAKVYEGRYGEAHVAIKIFSSIDWMCFAHEIVIIAHLKHACIPKFYGIVNEDNTLALVFQFIKGKNLDEFKPSEMTQERKIKIALSIGSVLENMHVNNFVHRDIKPENVMIDEHGNAYLIDFGIATVCTSRSSTLARTKGTLLYLAPECMDIEDVSENEEIISLITPKVDVWSFGCIISWLFSGVFPWNNKYPDDNISIQRALTTKKPFPMPEALNENETIKKVIEMAMIVDYQKRADMRQINELIYSLA